MHTNLVMITTAHQVMFALIPTVVHIHSLNLKRKQSTTF